MNEHKRRPPLIPGRISRVRYATYMMALGLLCGVGISLLWVMAVQIPGATKLTAMRVAAIGITCGVLPVGGYYFTVLRAHDFGATGLTALLILAPLFLPILAPFIACIFMCWPGQGGDNHFGPPPPRNGKALIATCLLLWGFMLACVGYAWLKGPVDGNAGQPPRFPPMGQYGN